MSKIAEETREARRIRAVVDVRIDVTPPSYVSRLIREPYGTEKYWLELEKAYREWVNEFRNFLQDHRSQDGKMVSVEKTIEDVCSNCSEPWETDMDDRGTFCLHCGALVVE